VVADSFVLPCLLEAVRQGNRQLLVAAKRLMEMKKLIHKFDITPDDLGLQLNINNL